MFLTIKQQTGQKTTEKMKKLINIFLQPGHRIFFR